MNTTKLYKTYTTTMNINKQDIDKIATAAENRWGAWAKYILGALIGALAAAGVITVTGCTASYTRAAVGALPMI